MSETQESPKTIDDFWNTDLSVIEESFLPEGTKITDLPICFHDAVPHQGSILLKRARLIEDE
jgi:hypothetical protein